jgi:uncharacterized protein GlcG (DUF336 family)
MTEALTLANARAVVAAALAVVDARGELILAAGMDGARSYDADIAYGEAMGSALWEQPSRAFGPEGGASSVRQRVNALQGGRIVFAPGAVPLRRDGAVIGAVGVGGSGPDSDEAIALYAAVMQAHS